LLLLLVLPTSLQGAFVGALVAMSSTSIVLKVLTERRTLNTQPGQITIGTLILQARAGLQLGGLAYGACACFCMSNDFNYRTLPGCALMHSSAHQFTLPALQDCLVGLLFAFMPVLATASGGTGFDIALLLSVMGRVVVKLAVLAAAALLVARTVLPPTMRFLARRFGADSFQLASIAFCLLCALGTARQGLSAELGAFVAGVMLSATEQQEAVLHHLGEHAAGCRRPPPASSCGGQLPVCLPACVPACL
jgi:Kef-type K+ transport system membrane component KefB